MPVRELLREGHEVTGWFYNPNIHPLTEYLRRRESAQSAANAHGIPLLFPADGPDPAACEYDVMAWSRAALGNKAGRCAYCRSSRLKLASEAARYLGFDAFTSSLLYSRRQDHEGMRAGGEAASKASGIPFLYRDFRLFWQDGINASKELGIYRQQYCGCVFSEEDRYTRDLAKALTGVS